MKLIGKLDNKGVESIPLKLIIVALCLALIIPATLVGITAFSNNQSETNLKDEINRIVSTIKQSYDGDEGTSFSLKVNFEEGVTRKLDYVKIGDKMGEHGGPHRSVIRYKFKGESVSHVIIRNPNIQTTSPSNSALELGPGKHTLIAEKYLIGETGFIVVRTPDEDARFKMADVAIYKNDITVTNRDDNIAGLIINADIQNIGTLNTSDPEAKWSGDGKIRISFWDRIVMTGEIRSVEENLTIDDIPAKGSLTTSVEWFPVQEDDDPQDPRLRKREITVMVDVQDNIDEVAATNNKVKINYENQPPVVNHITAEIDDEPPGIGSFVVGVDAMNTLIVNASDPDGWVRQVSFWWGDKTYPEDKEDPSHYDDTLEDGFTASLNMGQFEHTTNLMVKPYDNAGFGGDACNDTIYMEIVPEWMDITETRAKEEGEKDFGFDYDKRTFKLYIDVPGDLMKGFDKAFGGNMPFLSGLKNSITNSYPLEIEIPIGADVNFSKEVDLGSKLFDKKMDGTGWVDATIHIGLDKSVDINLSKIFDLIEDARHLLSYWKEFKEMLNDIEWDKIKNPTDTEELITALEDAYNKVKEKAEFSEIKEIIDSIKETIQYYENCFDELLDLWKAIMNFMSSPDSLLNLVSFEAEAGLTLSKDFDDWKIFSVTYPILPPFINAEMEATASLSASFEVVSTFQGDLSGLDFFNVNISSEVDFGLAISFYVKVGVDFGFAGGGIKGGVTGSTEFTLNTGAEYFTSSGFHAFFDGLFKVMLEASLKAYAKFMWWEKEWPFWKDSWTLGEWHFDLMKGKYDNVATKVTTDVDEEDVGDIDVPRGPVMALDGKGKMVFLKCEDLETEPTNAPNYEVMYSWDFINWHQLTNNTKVEAEPAIIFNSTGSAFAFWTQCGENDFLTDTELTVQEILQYAEVCYAIWDKEIGLWNGPYQFTTNSVPDFHPIICAGPESGEVGVVWIRDTDGQLATPWNNLPYYSIWNGSAWSEEKPVFENGSINYYYEMENVSDGRYVSIWVHDEDENLSTTADQQIMYSILDNGNWSEPGQLTDENTSKKFISLGSNGDKVILVWLSERNGTWSINSRTWDMLTGSWSSIELINESKSIIQYPLVEVTPEGIAVLTWKSNYDRPNSSDPEGGYIYFSTKDLYKDTQWTAPRIIASSNTTSDFYSTMALLSDNEVIYTYRNNASLPREHPEDDLHTIIFELKPDLTVTNVLIDGADDITATEGETVFVDATLSNLGDIDAENVNISFYDGDPDDIGTLIGFNVLESVPRVGDSETSMEWQVVKGVHKIYVVIDPDQEISEHDEENNIGFCTVNCLPDLWVETQDITFSLDDPNEGEEIQIRAKIHNDGYAKAENVTVVFYDGDPRNGGIQITTLGFVIIEVDDMVEALGDWTVLSGNHEIFVEVDDSTDIDPTNNLASKVISILPDLSIDVGDLTLSASELIEGEEVTISASVYNLGSADAENVIVKFCTSNTFIGYKVINVSAGGSKSVSIIWQPSVGQHVVYVILDPGNQIPELNEANNMQHTTLTVFDSMDLTIDLELEGKKPGEVEVTAEVHNNGDLDVYNVSIDFYDSDPENGGILINSITIDHINKNDYAEVTFEWQTEPGTRTVYAVVDGLDQSKEIDEANNEKSETVNVKEKGQGEDNPWPLILIILVIIAVPVILILFYWRRRISY